MRDRFRQGGSQQPPWRRPTYSLKKAGQRVVAFFDVIRVATMLDNQYRKPAGSPTCAAKEIKMTKPLRTPAPWNDGRTEVLVRGCQRVGLNLAFVNTSDAKKGAEAEANARLIAASPDHALIAAAVCSKAGRWESWDGGLKGEFCIGGIRHSTELDEFGVPAMTHALRVAIQEAMGGCV